MYMQQVHVYMLKCVLPLRDTPMCCLEPSQPAAVSGFAHLAQEAHLLPETGRLVQVLVIELRMRAP